MISLPVRGRGASHNPANRFEPIEIVRDRWEDPEDPAPRTQLFWDTSRTIIARNASPDVGFETSVNPYRGCEHGCVYCYARPYHEYLGLSAGLDFETKIFVKEDAPRLLREALMKPSWTPQTLALSGVTDPYQPAERRLQITRGCLEVLADFRNPTAVVTKNHLVTRDIDHLGELARFGAAAVTISITTLDDDLQRRMEPRASSPARRLDVIARLSTAGIPVGVNLAPVVPGLTDHELPRILEAAAEAGARRAGYLLLRLPYGVKDLFQSWLEGHFPDRKEKVLARLRSLRGGRLNDPRFGKRHRGEGPFAAQIANLFRITCRRLGLNREPLHLSAESFRRRPRGVQLRLFD
ncbi:MAG: PA0069 family radical SAM protein [Gemmatimonadetes bacterium]|uniref:PA0069 family radical SAM protein n=1 Tax=Candidatus Kutchimonas denitrificans TaxID=3056748 RepID=A0AAE4ZA16_9BACT|nr:PA0069 family radical SAM protein [Gemmatimonadota bacterium]NIR74856.1 PA0069 family radical SAM protein [Candidatus Kutchimonas denitrificans]NIR99967.1 PA0069 family radical SAM protein [Gemmatimonadota bacterium]NIT65551.1 PA0069 family radical SAM protein [Gemmatimonadota bacterium]NIU52521.1 PA0069 family radical SAM protein [Gemmatimonadota bacterium]